MLLLTSGATTLFTGCEQEKEERPNIVLILADDLGWTDLGCMGSDYYETPHIDKLRSNGMLFTQAYSNAANSAPSRACLMTGLYTPRHGIYTVNPPDRGKAEGRKLIPFSNNRELPVSYTLLPRYLKTNGYNTCHVGKWHLGSDERGTGPLSHGFDVNKGGGDEGSPYSYFFPYCSRNGKCLTNLEQGEEGEYLTDRLTDEAVSFIRQQSGEQPFFLYMAHHAVHTPLQAKEELIEKYRQKKPGEKHNNPVYAAMVQSLDESVGLIIKSLEETGQLDNTLIIFMSDNGGMLNNISDNYPLRGGKGNPYEGGNRVPIIVQWNGKVKAGSTCRTPVTGADLYPTVADLLGVAPLREPDGKSITPLLYDNQANWKERDLYFFFPAYLENYGGREGFRATPYSSVVSGDWKLIHFFEDNRNELYYLKEDIGETNNLAEVEKAKEKELYHSLQAWQQELLGTFSFEENPKFVNRK